MPLPPAPTQRASRLTHTAFEAASTEEDTQHALIQIETKAQAVTNEQATAIPSQRPPRGRKATAAAPQPRAKAQETSAPSPSQVRAAAAPRPKR